MLLRLLINILLSLSFCKTAAQTLSNIDLEYGYHQTLASRKIPLTHEKKDYVHINQRFSFLRGNFEVSHKFSSFQNSIILGGKILSEDALFAPSQFQAHTEGDAGSALSFFLTDTLQFYCSFAELHTRLSILKSSFKNPDFRTPSFKNPYLTDLQKDIRILTDFYPHDESKSFGVTTSYGQRMTKDVLLTHQFYEFSIFSLQSNSTHLFFLETTFSEKFFTHKKKLNPFETKKTTDFASLSFFSAYQFSFSNLSFLGGVYIHSHKEPVYAGEHFSNYGFTLSLKWHLNRRTAKAFLEQILFF